MIYNFVKPYLIRNKTLKFNDSKLNKLQPAKFTNFYLNGSSIETKNINKLHIYLIEKSDNKKLKLAIDIIERGRK